MKRASRSTSALVAALVLALARPSGAQTAADKETARELFEVGKDRRDRGDWSGALESFRAADAIMNVPTTKLAVARAYAALAKFVEARDAALQVALLPTVGRETQAFTDAREAAAELAAELVDRLASLRVVLVGAPETGETQVTIDGVSIPEDALEMPRRVNPGKHVVVATLRGGEVRREVGVAEKQSASATLDVTALAKEPVRAPIASGPRVTGVEGAEPPRSGLGPMFWAGISASAVGLAVGTAAGVVSMGHKSDADAQCRDGRCPPSAHGALDQARDWATVSTTAFAVAGAGAVLAGVGLFLRTGRAATPAAGAYVEPVVGATGAGLRGEF